MRAAIEDVESCGLTPAEKALLRFVRKLNAAPGTIERDDVATLHEIGWDDEAVYDAIGVCALFNFYNRWIDGNGVHGTPELYKASGKRMATGGYSR